jgi:hypothetical protein
MMSDELSIIQKAYDLIRWYVPFSETAFALTGSE